MAKLTPEQISFLKSHKISLRDMFDVSAMTKSEYMAAMDEAGQHFTFGGAPCKAARHTLRTKSGHCIQCDTSKIAFALRSSATAYVYIGGSFAEKLLKVGVTKDLNDRFAKLNDHRYGGGADWDLLAYVHTKNAGTVEFDTQEKLSPFSIAGVYIHVGREQACYELFRCPFSAAKEALIRSAPRDVKLFIKGHEDRILANYEF
jgi:hypothetical protein